MISLAVWWLLSDTLTHHGLLPDRTIAALRGGVTDIRFAHFGSHDDFGIWKRIIKEFENHSPDIRVHQEFVPGWYGRFDTKLTQQALARTLPDVILIQSSSFHYIAPYLADWSLAPTSPSADHHIDPADFHPTSIEMFRWIDSGRPPDQPIPIRAAPFAGGSLLIYVNTECLANAPLNDRQRETFNAILDSSDWTMDQFQGIAQSLTCDFDADGQMDQWGFWLPRWLYYMPFVWSFGADLVSDDGNTWTLHGRRAESAFSFYRTLARDHRACPRPSEMPQIIQDVGFLTGKVAMCVNGPWFEPFLTQTKLRDSYRVMPIPSGPAGRSTRITWDGLAVAANIPDRRIQAARRFVRFCIGHEIQDLIAETGRWIPARKSSLARYSRDGQDARRREFVRSLDCSRPIALGKLFDRFGPLDRVIDRHLNDYIAEDSSLSAAQFLSGIAAEPIVATTFSANADAVP